MPACTGESPPPSKPRTASAWPLQLSELRTLAAQRGYTIVGEFIDEGVSGAVLERPALDRLRAVVRDGGTEVVLAHASDRLARDLMHLLVLRTEMRRKRVRLEYKSHSPEDSAVGQFQEQVLGAVAELERATIRERTSRGRREKARRGLVPGGPVPFGFRPDPTTSGKFVVDEAEAEVVRRMFAWLLEGLSTRDIARRLHAQGIRPHRGATFGVTSVSRIVKNRAYAGEVLFNRNQYRTGPHTVARAEEEHIRIPVPAIVSVTTFERAQRQLARNATTLVGTPGRHHALLRGLLVCARCGRRFLNVAMFRRSVRVYRCGGKYPTQGEGCAAPVWRAEVLDTAVWDAVTSVLRDPTRLLTTMKTKRLALDAERVDAAAERAELQGQLAAVQAKRSRLLDLYLGNHLAKPAFEAKDLPMRTEEERLAALLRQAEATVAQGTADAGRHASALAYCKLIATGLDRLDAQGRQGLLRLLVDRVAVWADRLEVHGLLPVDATPPPRKGGKRLMPESCANRTVHRDARPDMHHFEATEGASAARRESRARNAPLSSPSCR